MPKASTSDSPSKDPRDALSEALFRLHEAAQDAANDPERKAINAVHDAYRRAQRLIGAFYFHQQERTRDGK